MVLFLPVAFTAIIFTIASSVLVWQLRRILKEPSIEAARIIDQYSKQIELLELETAALIFIKFQVLTELEAAILDARSHRFWYKLFSRLPIGLMVTTTALTVLASGVWSSVSAACLALIGLIGAVSSALGWIDRLDQNGPAWKYSGALEFALRDALDELLAVTPGIPLTAQFSQFAREYQAIRLLKQQSLERHIDASQTAAKEITEQVQANNDGARAEYHRAYGLDASVKRDPTVEVFTQRDPITEVSRPEVPIGVADGADLRDPITIVDGDDIRDPFTFSQEVSVADGIDLRDPTAEDVGTIAETDLTPSQYIAMSTSGEDSAVFLSQGDP